MDRKWTRYINTMLGYTLAQIPVSQNRLSTVVNNFFQNLQKKP